MRKRTGRIAAIGSLVAAGALCLAGTAAHAATINVGSASGDPGSTVTFDVTLSSGGASVAGTQNDISFDASTPIVAKTNGKPTCTVNAAIDKTGTSFAFQPAGCAATSSCTGIRAIVFSTDNTDAIADGATLYTCTVAIAADASGGDHPLTASGVILSDPTGGRVSPADSTNGAITVSGGGNPTPTPGSSCAEPKAPPAGPAVYVDDTIVDAAGTVTITAKLAAGGANIAGTQNDITFDAGAPVLAKTNGKPDCTVNAAIDKTGTSFAFQPAGCAATSSCTGIRAIVFSTDNTDAIPDGSALYTCNVDLSGAGTFNFVVSGVILSDPTGGRIEGATGQDGSVCLGGAAVTPTPGGGMCPDPRTAPAGPAVWVMDNNLEAAGAATLTVNLAAGGQSIAGTQNDIAFESTGPIGAKTNGKPDCTVNAAIDKTGTSFAFQPAGCAATSSCTGIRAIVFSTDNTDAIPDGSTLYTCNIPSVTATTAYTVSGVILSDPTGGRISGASGQDGQVCVPGVQPPTATPVATNTPVPPTATNTVAVPPTNTVKPTATATATPQAVTTAAEDEGGCQIAASGAGSGWLLLIPAIGLLVIRRRRSR